MPRNTLVINCDIRETRVALIEEGIIAELQIERAAARGTVGNIVLGRVTRVLPGMQAAFIDVGMERAAFLHVEDLIRPDDFEAYLSGSRRHEDAERFSKGEGGKRHQAGAAATEAHDHDHDHDHDHGRNYSQIRKLINKSSLSGWVKEKSVAVFHRIAVAEGKIHGHPPEKVHFHEVGAVDSL